MRILHTADWHLGDRLGGVDRTADLRRAVERVAGYCAEQRIDVCLIAGDIFSDRHPRDRIHDSIEHLAATFETFLLGGGTVLALTGNHDSESFCQTLKQMMRLAAPTPVRRGDVVTGGRWYLATGPSFLRLKDASNTEVQFVLMPYPTISRYLGNQELHFANIREKHLKLHAAFLTRLHEIQASSKFSSSLPTVFAAHAFVGGAVQPQRFRISEWEDIVFRNSEIPSMSTYVALGHLHRPQFLQAVHVRYSGSIERLDMGERNDAKQVILVEIGGSGLLQQPVPLPLASTPFYDVRIADPQHELPTLRQRFPEAARALVRYHVTFTPGRDNLNEILAEINRVFPRWYDRSWTRSGGTVQKTGTYESHYESQSAPEHLQPPLPGSFYESVMQYLGSELDGHTDREAVLKLAEAILAEEPE